MKSGGKLPPLKEWTQRTLTERDWDFQSFCNALERVTSQLPEDEASAVLWRAFTWEIDRELGSGNGPFDLKKELAMPSARQFDSREHQVVLERQNGPTVTGAIEQPLWLPHQPMMDPLRPQGVCITGISSFVEKLRQQASPLARFLMGEFSEATRKLISEIPLPVMGRQGERGDDDKLIRVFGLLDEEIKRIIRSGSIFRRDRFKGVSISAETKSLLDSVPTGEELVRLNRLLLEDAFPLEITRGPRQKRALNEWHLGALAGFLTPDTFSASRASNNICALEIPWHDDDDDVVEAFRLWLQRHRGRQVGKEGAGRKHEWPWWFTFLAIYRFSAAGYERDEVMKKVGGMSASRYNRAVPFIKVEMERRFGNKPGAAQLFAEKSSKSGDWYRHLLKQQPCLVWNSPSNK